MFSISGGNNMDDEGGRHNVPRAFTAGTQEAALDRWKRRFIFLKNKTFLLFFSVFNCQTSLRRFLLLCTILPVQRRLQLRRRLQPRRKERRRRHRCGQCGGQPLEANLCRASHDQIAWAELSQVPWRNVGSNKKFSYIFLFKRRVAPDTGTGERRKPSTSSSVAPGGTPYPQAVRISRGEEFAQGLLGCCNSPAICTNF